MIIKSLHGKLRYCSGTNIQKLRKSIRNLRKIHRFIKNFENTTVTDTKLATLLEKEMPECLRRSPRHIGILHITAITQRISTAFGRMLPGFAHDLIV